MSKALVTAANVPVVTTNQTTVFETPVISASPVAGFTELSSNAPLPPPYFTEIRGYVAITPGTGTTNIEIHMYEADGATFIDSMHYVVTAGVLISLPFIFTDATGYVTKAGGGRYVITVSQTGATANGTVSKGECIVEF